MMPPSMQDAGEGPENSSQPRFWLIAGHPPA
jgi:hypothetical protein